MNTLMSVAKRPFCRRIMCRSFSSGKFMSVSGTAAQKIDFIYRYGRPSPQPRNLRQFHSLMKVSSRYFSSDSSQNIDYEEFLALVNSGSLQLFDVREPTEVKETGIIPGAVNIPIGELGQAFLLKPEEFKEKYNVEMPKKDDANVTFYCLAGVRSAGALAMVQTVGFKNCRHYPGGWAGWAERQKSTPN